MTLPIPILDDKTFAELVDESVRLIPQLSKEWTDFNIHDPGITFIELFAWLAEMQIYQLDQVTEKNYRTFLKLVGTSVRDVQPAVVDIEFDLSTTDRGRLVEAGTKLVPIGKDEIVFETAKDVFLTKNRLEAVFSQDGARILDQSNANNKPEMSFYPFGESGQTDASLWMGFTEWFEEKEIHLTFDLFEDDLPTIAHVVEDQSNLSSVELEWSFGGENTWQRLTLKEDTTFNLTRSGTLIFETPTTPNKARGFYWKDMYWLRCRLVEGRYEVVPRIVDIKLNVVPAVQIETILNETLGEGKGSPGWSVSLKKAPILLEKSVNDSLLQVGDILDWAAFMKILKGYQNSSEYTPANRLWQLLDSPAKEWLGADLPKTQPELDNRKYDVISAVNRVLGNKDYYDPDYFRTVSLPTAYRALLDKLEQDRIESAELKSLNRFLFGCGHEINRLLRSSTLVIQSAVSGDWKDWALVENFENSGPSDQHYQLDAIKGDITFGNGLNGRVPQVAETVRAYSYKTSLGKLGNLTAGQKWRILKSDLMGVRGQNHRPAKDGDDAESIEDTISRARYDFTRRFRAVTLEDYEELAQSTPGLRVARAKALLNYHPFFPCTVTPGAVTVVVLPFTRDGAGKPTPSRNFLETVRRHLDAYRLVTVDLHVIVPSFVQISVTCTIHLNKSGDGDLVRQRATKALNTFLSPLAGGADRKGWPLGRSVYSSEIFQLIDQLEGVDYVTDIELRSESEIECQSSRWPWQKGRIHVPRLGMVNPGTHNLKIELGT